MTSTTKTPRPPNDRGQGRKAMPEDEVARVYPIRLKPDHQKTYREAGHTKDFLRPLLELGAPKLRELVAKVAPPAPAPKEPPAELTKAQAKLARARVGLEKARVAVKTARAKAKAPAA